MLFLTSNQQYQSTPVNNETHTHPLSGPFSRTTRVSQYQKGKTNLDYTEARDGATTANQQRQSTEGKTMKMHCNLQQQSVAYLQ